MIKYNAIKVKLIEDKLALESNTLDIYQENPDQIIDEVDLAASVASKELTLKIKGRQGLGLAKINLALRKLELGTYGTCEECEDQININRLTANPTCELCISCKGQQESESSPY